MAWQAAWEDPLTASLTQFASLIGDARTRTTLTDTVPGSIAAGSRGGERIAAPSAILVAVQRGRTASGAW